jgi:hypothetical protein
MDDLMKNLQQFLSTPEGQAQLQNIASMLNNKQNSSGTQTNPMQGNNQNAQNNANGGLDMSGLMGMLNNANQQSAQNHNQNNANGGMDFSNIMAMLSNLQNANQNSAGNQSGPDMAAISNMLANLNNNNSENTAMPGIDMNTVLKLQQVFQSINVNDKNTQLLLALKPHFSERRRQKVDQAISMMRLMAMLPALKESGIFAGL